MTSPAFVPYAPLNILKPFADEVWIVDGPEIGMRYLGLTFPFPTRVTVVRLPTGDLWIHSPIAWNDDLGDAIAKLGRARYLIAPNTLHYWYLPDWQARFPQARSYGPPGLVEKARRPITIDETLSETAPAAWNERLRPLPVSGQSSDRTRFLASSEPHAHPYRHHREFRARTRARPAAALADASLRRG